VLKEEVKTLNEEYEAMRLRLGMTEEMQQGHDVRLLACSLSLSPAYRKLSVTPARVVLAPAQALGVGNVVDIREEYTSDDEDKDERLASGKPGAPWHAAVQRPLCAHLTNARHTHTHTHTTR
jgi:hypothetical protein